MSNDYTVDLYNALELDDLAVWDQQAITDRIRNTERLKMVIELSLEGFPKQLETLKTHIDALDFKKSEHVAHTLKGELGNLSADRSACVARAIEMEAKHGRSEALLTLFETLVKEHQALVKTISNSEEGVNYFV